MIDKLTTIKERIELQNTKVIRLEGQEEAYFKHLKDEYGCDSFEEADKIIKKEITAIKKLETKLEKKIDKLDGMLINE